MDQGSNKNHSPAYNFTPTVTKFCVMWEGLSLPHDTKFGNCRCKIVDSRSFHSWSLIHGLRWSGLIKVGPGETSLTFENKTFKLFRRNINIYLHFMSSFHIIKTQVVEILPQVRHRPTYSTKLISWLLMSWSCKEPSHQQPRYWLWWTGITQFLHIKG